MRPRGIAEQRAARSMMEDRRAARSAWPLPVAWRRALDRSDWEAKLLRRLTHSMCPPRAAMLNAREFLAVGFDWGIKILTHSAWPSLAAQRRTAELLPVASEKGMSSRTHSAWPSLAAQRMAAESSALGVGAGDEQLGAFGMAGLRGPAKSRGDLIASARALGKEAD